jgi:hypothetical protein
MDGGVYENCSFQNIIIETGGRWTNHYPIFIDIDKRVDMSKLGIIRNIQFQNLQIMTAGNVLIAGQPNAPLQNIMLKDIYMTLTGLNDLSKQKKPRGNKSLKRYPDMKDLSPVSAHFTLGYIDGLTIENIKIFYDKGVENKGERKDFELIEVKK